MRISDWSSDVCSSDLGHRLTLEGGPAALRLQPIGLDRPPGLQIDQREVAVIADGDAAFSGDVVEALGAGGSQVDQPLERQLARSEEHTSELQSLMRISYAVFCLKKKNKY